MSIKHHSIVPFDNFDPLKDNILELRAVVLPFEADDLGNIDVDGLSTTGERIGEVGDVFTVVVDALAL